MAETVKVATTMRPSEEIEVGEAEFLDLLRQKLIKTVNGKPLTKKQEEEAVNGTHGN
jgi:hypothetical protein